MIQKCSLEVVQRDGSPQKDVEEFIKSGWDACEVDVSRYKNANSANSSIRRAIKEKGYHDIQLVLKEGKIYLVKRSMLNG